MNSIDFGVLLNSQNPRHILVVEPLQLLVPIELSVQGEEIDVVRGEGFQQSLHDEYAMSSVRVSSLS